MNSAGKTPSKYTLMKTISSTSSKVFIVSSDIECFPSEVKSKLKSVKETSVFVRIINNIKTREE